jgi:hypothetical protein
MDEEVFPSDSNDYVWRGTSSKDPEEINGLEKWLNRVSSFVLTSIVNSSDLDYGGKYKPSMVQNDHANSRPVCLFGYSTRISGVYDTRANSSS